MSADHEQTPTPSPQAREAAGGPSTTTFPRTSPAGSLGTARDEGTEGDAFDFPGSDLELEDRRVEADLRAESCPYCMAYEWDAYEETGTSETLSEEWPGLTEALYAMEIETTAEDRVLERLKQITLEMHTQGRPGGTKQKKRRKAKLTVDERLKRLHVVAPGATEEESLEFLGELLDCSPSAFIGGDYYENELKLKREVVKAARATKPAKGPDRYEAEDRDAIRNNRAHLDSYEDIDDQIDRTWGQRRGGRFAE